MVQVVPTVVQFPTLSPATVFPTVAPNVIPDITGVLRDKFLLALSQLTPGGVTAFQQYVGSSPDDPINIALTSSQFIRSGDVLTTAFLSYATSSTGLNLSASAAATLLAQILQTAAS